MSKRGHNTGAIDVRGEGVYRLRFRANGRRCAVTADLGQQRCCRGAVPVAPSGAVRRSGDGVPAQAWALSYWEPTDAGMRPRSLTWIPCCFAHSRTADEW